MATFMSIAALVGALAGAYGLGRLLRPDVDGDLARLAQARANRARKEEARR
ncbi:hypothetical protein [Nocardiopsis halophila]|uniref:hypothetical protein n=1 Tax=Nocardiopsis halophila TaxID=141692 RepID=UPI00034DD69F|nr:hypothetical protein [Nocardiopsis halophila]